MDVRVKSFIRATCSFIIFYCLAHFAFAQSVPKLPLNPVVKYGKLGNGLQYYITRNDNSTDIGMQLMVDAGFQDEEPDQLGLAHFVEHLGLRSTKHFPEGVRKFFSENGGQCVASTGGTTDYHLSIPANTNLLDSAILALSDCAGGISFLPEEIEQERSAVLREMAGGDNKPFRASKQIPFLQLDKNPYYIVASTGQIENVKTIQREQLIRFYKEWYYPMYQTVFVVGNVNVAEVEKMVDRYFSGFSNKGAKQKANLKTLLDVPLHANNKLVVVEHGSEIQSVKIELYKKRKLLSCKPVRGTQDEIKTDLCYVLVNRMLENRLKTLRQNDALLPEAIAIDRRAIAPSANIEAITTHQIITKSSGIKQAIQSAASEWQRLEKFGFSEAEVSRAKETMLSDLKALQNNSLSNSQLLISLQGYHLEGHAFAADESGLKIKLLNSLTVKEINSKVMPWLQTKGNIDIVLSVPELNDPEVPTETEAFAWMNEAKRLKVVKYEKPRVKSLPRSPAMNPRINYSIQKLEALGATRLEFENGAVVLIKPLDKNGDDKIEIQGFNRYSRQRLSNSHSEIEVLKDVKLFTGFSTINATELSYLKTESKVGASPFISDEYIKFTGYAKNSGVETLFHLINLYMTDAKPDDEAFKRYCSLHTPESSVKKRLPSEMFEDTISAVTGRFNSIEKPGLSYSRERLKDIFQSYRKNFTDPAEFVFIITGTFDKEQIIQFAARYIGALSGREHRVKETKITDYTSVSSVVKNFIPGSQITFESDSAKNGLVCILFEGIIPDNEKDKLALQVANVALRQLFFDRLRQKEKGVYGVNNNLWVDRSSHNIFLDVRFDCFPKDVQRLALATRDELQLLTGSLSDTLFANSTVNIRKNLIYEANSSTVWMPFLLKCEQAGDFSASDELNKVEILDSLTVEDVTNAAKKYFNTNDYMVFGLFL